MTLAHSLFRKTISLLPGVPTAGLDAGSPAGEPAVAPERQHNAAYEDSLFVAPGEALPWMMARIEAWKQAQPGALSPGDRVLRLVGERGVGKTWLLRHLAEQDAGVSPQRVYLDLERRTGFPKPRAYVRGVRRKIGRRGRAILLLDTVLHELDDHLRALEDRVLRPHLAERDSLVIMALAHPSRTCWRAPGLRGGDLFWMQPFQQPRTSAQLAQLDRVGLARYGLASAAVQDHGGGLPLLNYLLAQHHRVQACEYFLDYCFSRVPAEERATVRRYLEAVCVLEVLEHARVDRALEVYYHHLSNAHDSPPSAGEVRSTLRKYWFARSAPDVPGRIVLVESVRRAAREVLKVQEPGRYVAMAVAAHGAKGVRR